MQTCVAILPKVVTNIVRGRGRCDARGEGLSVTTPDLSALQQRIDLHFRDEALLRLALTHPSYANEHPEEGGENNERLEFLGDAALGFVVAEELYLSFPDEEEGRLTEWRSQLVMGASLAVVATRLDLGSELRLGRGEETTGGRERPSNLERVYEALLAAILLDQGIDATRAFIKRTMADEFDQLTADPADLNPKGALQQLAQQLGEGPGGRPEYVTVDAQGPEHAPHFEVEVRLDGETLGRGSGSSKQVAEKAAAQQALQALRAAAGKAQP